MTTYEQATGNEAGGGGPGPGPEAGSPQEERPGATSSAPDVLRCRELAPRRLEGLLGRFGLEVRWVGEGEAIPGSYWGAPEAGIVEDRVYVRPDTPVHSALHEGGHLVCAGEERRRSIHTDAGGTFAEEDAVCYLQVLLADELPEMGRDRMLADMDRWGYTFRLGSARAWFEEDAPEALEWLRERGLADRAGQARFPG